MELDQRILPGKRPLTCFDVEEAEKYIGKECYFTSRFENFENLSKVPHATLHNIDDSSTPFWCYGDDGVLCYDCFILPCEWVKESEKKYRAYTLAEWVDQHEIGEVIHCRNNYKQEFHVMYTGYVIKEDEDIQDIRSKGQIMLINMGYLLEELFNNYEICINGEWKPFGVEEQL